MAVEVGKLRPQARTVAYALAGALALATVGLLGSYLATPQAQADAECSREAARQYAQTGRDIHRAWWLYRAGLVYSPEYNETKARADADMAQYIKANATDFLSPGYQSWDAEWVRRYDVILAVLDGCDGR